MTFAIKSLAPAASTCNCPECYRARNLRGSVRVTNAPAELTFTFPSLASQVAA